MSIAEKLTTIAENEQRVFEAGKTAEWNEMWDGLQAYGKRFDYNRFCYRNLFIVDTDTTPRWIFKPKYNIKPSSAEFMFREANYDVINGDKLYKKLTIDLAQWLNDLGVNLDLSNCTNINSMFYCAWLISRVPVLDLSKCTSAQYAFWYNCIETIDGIISSETTAWSSNTFGLECPLKHCIFSGVIAKPFSLTGNRIDLDHESLLSILYCLKDYSGTTTKYTMTLGSKHLAKLTDAEKAIATQKGWTLA